MEAETSYDSAVSMHQYGVAALHSERIKLYFSGIVTELEGWSAVFIGEDSDTAVWKQTLMEAAAIVRGARKFLEMFREHSEPDALWLMHEIRNQLSVVSMGCEYLLDDRYVQQAGTKILASVRRAITVIARLLENDQASGAIEAVELFAVAHELVTSVQVWATQAALLCTSECTDVIVNVSRSGIEMALSNLLTNALQASATRIEVSVSSCYIDVDTITERWNRRPRKPGLYGFIEVTDNGKGMDESTRTSLFSKRVSTKTSGWGEGTYGIGRLLTVCSGAAIVESTPGAGTVIRLYFPKVSL